MSLLQLKVVLWKNLIIRKRHWFLTVIESLLPILLFFLIAYGRSEIPDLHKTEINYTTYHYPEKIAYDKLSVESVYLYFTPNTEFFQDIIKRTQNKYSLYNNNIKGFDSSEALLRYYASHYNDTVIAIVFNKNNRNNLDYIIRYHDGSYLGDLDTSIMYRNVLTFEPGMEGAYLWKGLLSIQKALDMSFIEKLSGKDLEDNVTINVEEFPYPPYTRDSAINTVFRICLPLMTIFSFIFLCPAVLKRVVEEKYSGTRELLKMVGMQSWMLWLGWFIYGMVPMLFSVICIVILMKVPFFGTEYPPIEYSDGTVLFVFLILYCMAAVVFCFAISSFFSKPTLAVIVGILIWILSYFVPKFSFGLEDSPNSISWGSSILLNLLPNMALHYGYAAMALYEEREIGIQWHNINKGSSGGVDDVTMLNVFIMLLVDIVVYMSLTLYVDCVAPGKYGVRKSVFFPLYAFKRAVVRMFNKEENAVAESVSLHNVEEGHGLTNGIEIQNLCKRFGNKSAVDNLCLNIYQNQITVLLGHNGAGKSTTMSMITGMIDVTSGNIKINGIDIKSNMDEIRKTLGLCPQDNLFFTDLTVAEHLQFFAMLKGKTAHEANNETETILKKLNLFEKKNCMANTLSGGMKRKLCLGMAIIGGSTVLILDEPTSGMDPESRRELWDVLLSWRRQKTILITTHFMEEADALGDRIAIMANGKIQRYGTPMELKKIYDTGYHLSLVIKNDMKENETNLIKNTIRDYLPNAQFKDLNGKNMVFVLPFEHNAKFSALLAYLEENKSHLNIDNVSISVTTLEDVFLKAKTEIEPLDNKDLTSEEDALLEEVNSGMNKTYLPILRIRALLAKKIQFFKKRLVTYLVPALIAAMFFFLAIYLSENGNGNSRSNGPELKLKLDVYKQTTAFCSGDNNELTVRMMAAYKSLIEDGKGKSNEVKDILQAIVKKGIENIIYYKEHMTVSAEFQTANSGINATALYNGLAVHSQPISLNLVTNSIAKAVLGQEYSISTAIWPLETFDSNISSQFSTEKVGILWLIMIPIGCLLIVGSFIVFSHMELSTKFAQIQYMCGVKPYIYWLVNFVADWLLYGVVILIMVVIMTVLTPFLGNREFLPLLILLLLYGMCAIPFAYLFSRKASASGAFSLFIIVGIFFGILLSVIIGLLIETKSPHYVDFAEKFKVFLMLVFPQFALTYSGVYFSQQAVTIYNMGVMSNIERQAFCMNRPNPCCQGATTECEKYRSYWPLLQNNFVYMLISCGMFLILNILWDNFFVKRCLSKIKYFVLNLPNIKRSKDETDRDLKKYQQNHKIEDEETGKSHYNTLRAKNLQKSYSGRQVVKSIDFSLINGECLGILGVNGAGKTTTFKMLTREEVVDEGVVEINDNSRNIDVNQDEYLKRLGYCPQSDALNYVLTGREILTLIANLRGVNDPKTVNLFLKMFELEEYADIPCGHYSGGNKRKLSLAVALIGYPQYVLLDEPTNGVDPSCRRKFWTLIKKVQDKKKLAFVLTSHSMRECEALCNTLKIMKNGKFEKEGTISELKKEFGGFSIKLKLTNKPNSATKEEDSTITNATNVVCESYDEVDSIPSEQKSIPRFDTNVELKAYFEEHYGAELKDEHSGLLHFYVKDKNKRWSTIFSEVEEMKSKNSHLIEDYAVSEASLEDVFLSVARSQDDSEDSKKSKRSKLLRALSTQSTSCFS